MLAVRVLKLDDEVTIFQVQSKALGRVLFEQVCNQLHLLEADYFGLEYEDMNGCKYWLDLEKAMTRQVGLSMVDPYMRFCVKFYTPDPTQLEEEFTRYLFCLQIKRDLGKGDIQCNDNTAAVLASYIVQAECGDFVQEDYPDHTYLSSYKFVPHQDAELERRIMENHRKHVGQSPAEADLNLLETARRCELYGMKMHPAKDHEGVPLNLSVAHMGIVVFQNYTKINTFSWAKIRKISFKRKRFLVKLLPEGYGYYKDTVEFLFDGRNECKNFWKKCVEHHGFFRCSQVKMVPRQKTRVLSRGSSFRYSGKTQKQMVEFVRENYIKRQTFPRDEGAVSTPGDVWSQSFRHSSSVHSSVANVGGSISAHPLLPLGDNQVVGTQASLSCGSMTLNSMNETEAGQARQYPQQPPQPQQRYRTTSLTTSTNTPTHTADVHDAGDMDTSPECGASLTPSPQHHQHGQGLHYRSANTAMGQGQAPGQAAGQDEEDSPFHQQQQQRAGQPKQTLPRPHTHSRPLPRTRPSLPQSRSKSHANITTAMSSHTSTASTGVLQQHRARQALPHRQQHQQQQQQQQQQKERNRSNSMNIEAIIIASVYSTDVSNRGLSTSFTRLSSKSTTSVNTDVFNTDQSTASTIACDVHHTSAHDLARGDVLRHHPNARPVPGIALIQASKDSADTDEIEGSDSDAAWSADSRGRGWNRPQPPREVQTSATVHSSAQQPSPQQPLYNWQRSASCKELHHDEIEGVKSDKSSVPLRTLPTNIPGSGFAFESPITNKTDAPVTRYDDSRRMCYSVAGSKTPSLDRSSGDVVAPDQKVYSSSYPGTTSSLSTESEDAGLLESGHGGSIVVLSSDPCGSQEELALSHDDISHGSYELLEKEPDEERSDGSKRRMGARSCSLDSGGDAEIFTMDDDMEEGYESGKADWCDTLSSLHKRKSTGDLAYEMPRTRPDCLRSNSNDMQQGDSFPVSGMDGKKLVGSVVLDRWGDYRMKVTDPGSVSPLPPRLPLVPFDSSDLPTGFEMPCTGEESDRKFKQIKESLKPVEKQEDEELALIKKYEVDRKSRDRTSIDLGESKQTAVDLKGRRSPRKESDKEFEDPSQMRTQIGRTRSDPHPGKGQNFGRLRRHMLMHQKSIDLPAEAEAKVESKTDMVRTTAVAAVTPSAKDLQGKPKSDIPYTLHKRHVMNGTAPESENKVEAKDVKDNSVKVGPTKSKPAPPPRGDSSKTPTASTPSLPAAQPASRKVPSDEEEDQTVPGSAPKKGSVKKKCPPSVPERKCSNLSSPPKAVDAKTSGAQSTPIAKSQGHVQSPTEKKAAFGKQSPPQKLSPTERRSPSGKVVPPGKISPPHKQPAEKQIPQGKQSPPSKHSPPGKPLSPPVKVKQTTPTAKSPPQKSVLSTAKADSSNKLVGRSTVKSPPKSKVVAKPASIPLKNKESSGSGRMKSAVENIDSPAGSDKKHDVSSPDAAPTGCATVMAEGTRVSPVKNCVTREGVVAPPLPIVKKRERSPVLFGRLGLSEGSAFTPVRGYSPTSARRTKSLDAPVVSVHRLPPADSFSSTDDTVDTNGETKVVTSKPCLIKKLGPCKEVDAAYDPDVIMEVPDEDKSLSPACDASSNVTFCTNEEIHTSALLTTGLPEDLSPLRPDSPHPFAENYAEAIGGTEEVKCDGISIQDIEYVEIPESLPDLSPREELPPTDLPSIDADKGEGPSTEDDDWASVEENLADLNDGNSPVKEEPVDEGTKVIEPTTNASGGFPAGYRRQSIQIQPIPQESLDDPLEYVRRKMSIEAKPIPQDSLDDVFDSSVGRGTSFGRPSDLEHLRRKMSIEGKPIPMDPEMCGPSARAKLLSTHMETLDLPSPDFPSPDLPSPDLPLVDCQPFDMSQPESKDTAPDDYESPDYASPYAQSPDYASPYMQSPVPQSPMLPEDNSSKPILEAVNLLNPDKSSKCVAEPISEECKDEDYGDDNVFEEELSRDEDDLSKEFDLSEESLSKTGDTAQHLLSQDSMGKDISDEPTYVDPLTLNTDDVDEKTLSVSLDKETLPPEPSKPEEEIDDVPPAIPEKPLCLRKPFIAKKPDIPKKPIVLRKLEPQYPELEKPPETPAKDYMTDEKPPIKSKPTIAKPARLNIVRQNSQEKSDVDAFSNEKVKIFIQGASTDRSPDKLKEEVLSKSRHGSSEDASTSSGVRPLGEKSSTWRPFLLESSGSSSLEEGLFPPDDSAHAGDEDEPSSTSNTREDEVTDIPSGFGYPCMGSNLSSSDLIGGYGSVYALSRTLSRISERSTTSEQERSDLEDIEDSTKPSSRSPSLGDESMMSSDHQPSLSSDPPSGSCELMPEDNNFEVTAKLVETPDGADASCTLVPPRLVVPATSRSASEGLSDYEFGELPEIPTDPTPLGIDDLTPTVEQRDYLDPPGISRYASMESGLDKIPGMSPVTEEVIPEDESDPELEFHELPALPGENGEEHEEALSPEVLASVIPPPKLSKDSSQSDLPSPEDPVKIFVEGIIPEELRGHIPPPLLPSTSEENNWPTPPSSSPLPVACNVETYDAGKPEEARKVTVTSSLESSDPPEEAREEFSFSDETENPTMQDEEVFDEPLTTSSRSYETLVTVRSRDPSAPRGSTGEDTSMAISEWSSSTSTIRAQSTFNTQSGSSKSGKSAHSHSHSHSGQSAHSHSAHSANSMHSAHSTHSLHSAHSTHSLSQATSFSQLQQLSQLSQSQATIHSQIQAQSLADLAKGDDTSLGASVSESARASSDDVFLTDYGSASSSEQQDCGQGPYMSSTYLKTTRSQSERSHRSSNYETFHENLYDDDPFISQSILSPTERQMKNVPSYPVSHSPTEDIDRSTLSRKRRSKKASSYDTSPKSPTAFAGDQGFDMDPYSKQRSRSISMKSNTSYYGNVASPPSSGDEAAATRKQALRKSLERPKSNSRNRTHSKSRERHRSDRSRSRVPHHARSPPSDYSSSTSDDGSVQRASNTIPRVSRRRKQFPSRRRSRAAAEEARDGRIHGISSAVSTPSVLGYGDPSAHLRRRDRRDPSGKNGGDQKNVSIKQGGLSKQSSV